jgi:hypothetical protein
MNKKISMGLVFLPLSHECCAVKEEREQLANAV